mmetsp:Transcript_47468/g.144484  ORF Transcript_47468/g.144484 Transcript_47468/m.144484 type:complete len:206 (-) Transcript_47468:151-768(-)
MYTADINMRLVALLSVAPSAVRHCDPIFSTTPKRWSRDSLSSPVAPGRCTWYGRSVAVGRRSAGGRWGPRRNASKVRRVMKKSEASSMQRAVVSWAGGTVATLLRLTSRACPVAKDTALLDSSNPAGRLRFRSDTRQYHVSNHASKHTKGNQPACSHHSAPSWSSHRRVGHWLAALVFPRQDPGCPLSMPRFILWHQLQSVSLMQ